MYVLIVEDCDAEQARLVDVVERVTPGAEVLRAASIQQTEAIVRGAGRIDAALLDVHLPDGYATELLPLLSKRFPECRPALMTAHEALLTGVLNDAVGAGVPLVSAKHFGERRLRQYLQALNRRRQTGESWTTVCKTGDVLDATEGHPMEIGLS